MSKSKCCPGCGEDMSPRLIVCRSCWGHLPVELRNQWYDAMTHTEKVIAARCILRRVKHRDGATKAAAEGSAA